ncbi:hypothetical protein EYE40_12885 [Glaciihabitans arcticus]|uniref:Glycoside-hydrolase family GH114 TIM-barrel domain-containing protein n=1 Tax=Glaciihabitans arcticus TaxID=2668039 RepID=A0A4Q9GVE6_9MICO|nr:endo alpha-1,4 polygalactosaminidase [Glaciihabitans arcticus]TBN58214.1 hypothetical protein EYE40_12885 [Glaciihabitans arcticus]
MKTRLVATALIAVLALAGCTSEPVDEVPEGETEGWASWSVTGNGPTFDYQLGGGYEPAPSVELVVRDRTDEPAKGVDTVCYVNGFQSQPGEAEFWQNEHPELILRDQSGNPVVDENWPDEFLLDASTVTKRAALVVIIGEWIDGCAADGFVGVEFDNLDSFTRSGDRITDTDNFALATALVGRAHEAGLEAGQKNAAEYAEIGKETIGFDFAITEECYRWDECDAYTDVYLERVYDIEYFDDLARTVKDTCMDGFELPEHMIFRDRDLVTPDDPAYQLESC